MILVSACLLGENCKYSGGNNKRNLNISEEKISVCPEVLGGMTTPRAPSEIEEGFDGSDVLNGCARVLSSTGADVTEHFVSGAEKALEIAKAHGVTRAYLKQSSPSCGCGKIYDGTFCGNKKSGDGVFAALLKKHGIEVTGVE